MGTKIAWSVLLAVGLMTMAWALAMDTSVEARYGSGRIHNLSLASQQLTFLITGGVLFLAGIVLFAFTRARQSPAENARQDTAGKAQAEHARESVTVAVSRASAQVGTALSSRRLWSVLLSISSFAVLLIGFIFLFFTNLMLLGIVQGTEELVALVFPSVVSIMLFVGSYFIRRYAKSILP